MSNIKLRYMQRRLSPITASTAARPSSAKWAKGPVMDRSLGGYHPVDGPDLREPMLTAKRPVEDLLEHFGPKAHVAPSKIIEVAKTDIPAAEANSHHPFAAPDAEKALGHGCTSMLH
jgi:hypothetical protein